MPNTYKTRGKAATAISTADVFVPRLKALSKVACSVLSPVLTRNEPIIDVITPIAAIAIGIAIALKSPNATTPKAQAEIIELT